MGATRVGDLIGLIATAIAGWLLFATTTRLNSRTFFQSTSVSLILLVAGLVAHGVHEFNEAGLIAPAIEHVWDLNPVLDKNSGVGQILKALLGYNGNPALTEVPAYAGYWVTILAAVLCSKARCDRIGP